MADVIKHVMVWPHLIYISNYDLYLFALCAEVFGKSLPESEFQLKFPLMKRPTSANKINEGVVTAVVDFWHSSRFINFSKFTL